MGFTFKSPHFTHSPQSFYLVCVTLTVCWWRLFFVHISTYVRITVIEVTVPFPAVLATDVGISR